MAMQIMAMQIIEPEAVCGLIEFVSIMYDCRMGKNPYDQRIWLVVCSFAHGQHTI